MTAVIALGVERLGETEEPGRGSSHGLEARQERTQQTQLHENLRWSRGDCLGAGGIHARRPGLGPRGELSQAISQNPFFTFPVKVTQPGKLTVTFLDTTGKKCEGSAEIKF